MRLTWKLKPMAVMMQGDKRMNDKKIIEDLAGESMDDMGLNSHFDSENNIIKKECTECGIELKEDHRYGDCQDCLDRRFGKGQY